MPVVPLVAVFGLAWVAEHLIEVAIVAGACGALAVAAVVALMRWTDRREAAFASRRAARRETLTARVVPQVSQAIPPAIEQHVHYHVHVADSQDAVRVFTAIPGQAGDAITGRK